MPLMGTPSKRPYHWKRYVLVLAVVWTCIIAASLSWNRYELKLEVEETARTQANMAYDKNVVYRRWNTDHGGVYVEVSDDIQPNPYPGRHAGARCNHTLGQANLP